MAVNFYFSSSMRSSSSSEDSTSSSAYLLLVSSIIFINIWLIRLLNLADYEYSVITLRHSISSIVVLLFKLTLIMKAGSGGFFKGTLSALKTSIAGASATTNSLQKERQAMEEKL